MHEAFIPGEGNPEKSLWQFLDRLAKSGLLQAHIGMPGEVYVQPTDVGLPLFRAVREINAMMGGLTAEDAAKFFYVACHMPEKFGE